MTTMMAATTVTEAQQQKQQDYCINNIKYCQNSMDNTNSNKNEGGVNEKWMHYFTRLVRIRKFWYYRVKPTNLYSL